MGGRVIIEHVLGGVGSVVLRWTMEEGWVEHPLMADEPTEINEGLCWIVHCGVSKGCGVLAKGGLETMGVILAEDQRSRLGEWFPGLGTDAE
eukprot:747574-Hanusia_phi.AAC.10